MLPKHLSDNDKSSLEVFAAPRIARGWRLFLLFSSGLALTGPVSMLFADLLWRTGWSASRTILLILFIILFWFICVGCMHGIFGFALRIFGTRRRISALNYRDRNIEGISTAIVFPIYNEDIVRVHEGIRATYESLAKTGKLAGFDIFILSDTTDPDQWVEEEQRWYGLIRELGALGKIYYRRRLNNEGRKSGNIRDFLNAWGRRYRYFIVCDADSVMRGETIVDLVKLMEARPGAGLIQTVPAVVNAKTLFGRIQQFANRLYAPIYIAGLNYWTLDMGNYWGHNAIIRVEPFMQFCDLPQLPGRKPFGGQILSHDFVEAALMLRENREVWLAYDLDGSYEEAPETMIENARRDRRWCQGNLQHGLVLFARGLRGVSRIHLSLGIFCYLTGPFWLAFLITFAWIRWYQKYTGLSTITVHAFTPYLNLSGSAHALLIFVICMAVIMLTKVLSLVELAMDAQRRRAFGGMARATASVLCETLFSTLHAPLQMLWHTRFVISNFMGGSVGWASQQRGGAGVSWSYAFRRHWGHTLTGIAAGVFMWHLEHSLFWWLLPLLAGWVLAVPLSVLTSRPAIGARFRNLGLFLTPEETNPPPELVSLREQMNQAAEAGLPAQAHAHLAESVLDPYINAIHVSLLREKLLNPAYAEQFSRLGIGNGAVHLLADKLLAEGPAQLTNSEKLLVMANPTEMARLHQQAWLRPASELAPWWQGMILDFGRRVS
ncbi:MAG: glucans biosynthesis glucosyltransferase MdoH [Verrucomicrobia bacterium]|nr:glucans biosynthesis glucosyltransferase MdoH [Verrucomicrobiota bacterium]MDE3098991.1 glucans biosynthesis glucosyltransferase MdoH [Verrucomicrobiota bacterium]